MLTPKQNKFFSKPRTMAEIMNDLFKGDAWAANAFQNEQIAAGTLEVFTDTADQYKAIKIRKVKTT